MASFMPASISAGATKKLEFQKNSSEKFIYLKELNNLMNLMPLPEDPEAPELLPKMLMLIAGAGWYLGITALCTSSALTRVLSWKAFGILEGDFSGSGFRGISGFTLGCFGPSLAEHGVPK